MTDLNQYRVQWTGLSGMPGVTTFYSTGAPGPLLAKIKTFFEAIKLNIPSGITFTFPGQGNVIDSATGSPKAQWISPAPANTTTTGTGSFLPPVGIVINWNTAVFSGGRQLRGKTFIVPVISGNWLSDGKMTAAGIADWTTKANAMTGGTDPLVVYSRRTGQNGVVTTATVPNLAAVLRSRRD